MRVTYFHVYASVCTQELYAERALPQGQRRGACAAAQRLTIYCFCGHNTACMFTVTRLSLKVPINIVSKSVIIS